MLATASRQLRRLEGRAPAREASLTRLVGTWTPCSWSGPGGPTGTRRARVDEPQPICNQHASRLPSIFVRIFLSTVSASGA